MTLEAKIFEIVSILAKKNPNNLQTEWFTIGFMFAHSMNNKSIEDIFNTVNNITTLSRMNALSVAETNDILLKMLNKLLIVEKLKNSQLIKNNPSNTDNQAIEGKANKIEPIETKVLQKSDTMELQEHENTVSIHDLSYNSDEDLIAVPIHDGKKQNEDLVEIDLEIELAAEKNKGVTTKYIKKPVTQVNLKEFEKPSNLKRLASVEEEELSNEIIKQLQEEDAKLQKMIEERKKKEEKAANEAVCCICLGSLMEEAFIPLEKCIHMFHNDCFAEYLKSQVTSRTFPIKCPSNCGKEVSEADVRQILDKDLLQKFYEYSLQKYVLTHSDEVTCCPTADCAYVFAQEKDGEDNILNCPLCKKTYCMNCRVEYHKKMTCKEYQINSTKDENDIKFEKFVKGKKFKQCNNCKFWVQKNKGCNHMTCRCGYQFCYKCGGKYGECKCR